MAALLVYDVSRVETLESVPRWLAELDGHMPPGTKIPIVLVANKVDVCAAEGCQERSGAFFSAGYFYKHVQASCRDGADVASSLAAVKACVSSVSNGDLRISPTKRELEPEKAAVGTPTHIDPSAVDVNDASGCSVDIFKTALEEQPDKSWGVGGEAAMDPTIDETVTIHTAADATIGCTTQTF